MKKALLSLIIVLACLPVYAENPAISIAGDDACYLYDAMDVEAQSVTIRTPNSEAFMRSSPGFSCTMWRTWMNGETGGCSCTFFENLTWFMKEQSYKILSVDEDYEQDLDTEIFRKTVGPLTFEKVTYIKFDREQRDYYFSVLGEKYQYQYK